LIVHRRARPWMYASAAAMVVGGLCALVVRSGVAAAVAVLAAAVARVLLLVGGAMGGPRGLARRRGQGSVSSEVVAGPTPGGAARGGGRPVAEERVDARLRVAGDVRVVRGARRAAEQRETHALPRLEVEVAEHPAVGGVPDRVRHGEAEHAVVGHVEPAAGP